MFGKKKRRIRDLEAELQRLDHKCGEEHELYIDKVLENRSLQKRLDQVQKHLGNTQEKYLLKLTELGQACKDRDHWKERLTNANNFIDGSTEYYGELFVRIREMMRPGEEFWNTPCSVAPWEGEDALQ